MEISFAANFIRIHTETGMFKTVSTLKILAGVFLLLFCVWPFAAAAATNSTAGPINVGASIPSGLALELIIVDQLSGATVPSMDFGELAPFDDEYRATRFFNVFLKVNTAGNAYELTQLSTPLTRTGGTETIPNGAFFVKPFYEETDNAGLAAPGGSKLGVVGTAVSAKRVFEDPTGAARTLRLQYTLTGDPITGATQVIPLGQKSGAYAGTVQFTLTTT